MPEKNINNDNYSEDVLHIKKFYAPAFIVAILLILGMGMYFLANIDKTYANKITPLTYEPVITEPGIPKAKGVLTPGIDINKYGYPTPELIAKGKELFTSNCSSCHGTEGRGDGPGSAALTPKPRNFTQKDGWKNGRELENMFKTLVEGLKGSAMNSYEFLPVADRFAILHYVRTFAPDFPQPTKDELARMDAVYSISKGKVTPNTIPVSLAMTIMENEGKTADEKIEAKLASMKNSGTEGYKLFRKYAVSPVSAMATLEHNQSWRSSGDAFVRLVSYSAPENGFCTRILSAKHTEITTLYDYLKSAIAEK